MAVSSPESVRSFVPTSLLQRLSPGEAGAPSCISFTGAVLYADISDYTSVAERLCEQGPEGVEHLATLLDGAFRRYVECIHETGGEVACFAGDALLAYWDTADREADQILWQATECARLLHTSSVIDMAPEAAATTLHIGVGFGEVWGARLGGVYGHWHVILAGQTVRDASEAAIKAGTGETVMTPAAKEIRVAGETAYAASDAQEKPDYKDPGQYPGVETTGLVPRVVEEWVAEGYAAWLPQFRNVCALFVRIDGLREDAHDALPQYQAAVQSLLTAIRPFTGSSGTLILDDKGLVFKLCLGLPYDAHADDILRAVRAGFAIEGELNRLGLQCAAGVAAGQGICMPLGGPERQHYVAVGRFMHIAARLMQVAGEGIVCTDEIAERVRSEVSISPERALELKGVKGTLRLYRVKEVPRHFESVQQLFGREFEIKQIETTLDSAVSGQGKLLWIVGDAGLGKTALANYVIEGAKRRDITCLSGGAGSLEIALPFVAWRSVFAELLAQANTDDEKKRVFAKLPHPELAPLINTVLPGFMGETPEILNLTGEARAKATLSVLGHTFSLAAPARFVLVLEDCHWMDSASWRLIVRVAQDRPDSLIVLTSRPEKPPPEFDALRRLDTFSELALSPLRDDAVRDLVETLIEGDAVGKELVDEITRRSVGNPLYAREYSLLLSSSDRHKGDGSGSSVPVISHHETSQNMPEQVEGHITSRLDSLEPEQHLVMNAASVLGDHFHTMLLVEMYPKQIDRHRIEEILTQLVEKDLLVKTGPGDSSFSFRHALIRAATYKQLKHEKRSELHRNTAEAIEKLEADDLEPHHVALARHWCDAENHVAAVKYADLAASHALASGAYLEATRLLEMCIDLELRDSALQVSKNDRVRWYKQLADAHHGLGELEARASDARRALAVSGRARPQTAFGLLGKSLVRAVRLITLRMFPVTTDDAETSLRMDLACAHRHSAEVCYFNNDALGMVFDCLSAVRMSEQAPPSAVLASASAQLGGILSIAGLRKLGDGILKRGVQIAETTGNNDALAYTHMINCLYSVGAAEWEVAERSAQLCQELCEPIDDHVNWMIAQAVQFWLNHYQGKSQAAHDAALRLQDRANAAGNRQNQAWALRYLSLCDLRAGRPEDAADRLDIALEKLGETAALNEQIPTLGLSALARLRMKEVRAGRTRAKLALALVARVRRPIVHSTLEAYSALTEVVLDAWREEPTDAYWRRELRRCLKILRRYRSGFRVGKPTYWLRKGQYYELIGKARGARKCYRHGMQSAEVLGMPWEKGQCEEALNHLSGRESLNS